MPRLVSALKVLFSGSRWLPALFFAGLMLLGIAVHRDYGVSWDEENNHLNGLVSLHYAARQLAPELTRQVAAGQSPIPDIHDFPDSDHGPIFEMTSSLLGYLFTSGDSRSMYFLRHLLVFATFVAAAGALFYVGRWRFRHWGWGLLGSLLLVLSPRFFAEAFYNGKDIVFMNLFTVGVAGIVWLRQRVSPGRVLLAGFLTALATDIRVQGLLLMLPALAVVLAAPAEGLTRRHRGGLALLYLLATLVVAFLGWPYLWATPLLDLLLATQRLVKYPWGGTVVYWGELVFATKLPWHYLPTWILITTPLAYPLLALLGSIRTFRHMTQTRLRSLTARVDAWLMLWLWGPLLLAMVVRPVMYDGWRHFYFIYPALVLSAVHGCQYLAQRAQQTNWQRWLPIGLLVAAGLELSSTAIRMIRMHPYQQLYFSFLPAPAVERHFERDYWGLAYRQGLEWLVKHDPSPTLPVHEADMYFPIYNNTLLLPMKDRLRVVRVPGHRARYILGGYRWRTEPYPDTLGREVYSLRVEGIKVLSIFQRY